MPGTYYYQDKNNVNGYITIIVNPKASSATHNLTVTTSGSNYVLSGSDRNGNIDNVEHATINMNVRDVLNLDVNVSGHPLWIKTSQTTGESNAVMDIPALNNGEQVEQLVGYHIMREHIITYANIIAIWLEQ